MDDVTLHETPSTQAARNLIKAGIWAPVWIGRGPKVQEETVTKAILAIEAEATTVLRRALTEIAAFACFDFEEPGNCEMNPDGDDARCASCIARAALEAK